jgi:hypothetical protein
MAPLALPFMDILDRISLSLYTNPTLPPGLYQLIAPKLPTRPTPGSTIPNLASVSTDDGSVQTNLSSVTGATGLRTAFTSRFGTSVPIPNPDPALQSLLPATVCLKELIGNDEVPRNEAGNPMCLAFHLRGLCNSTCCRQPDHARPLTADNKNTLSIWVIDTLAKRRVAGAITS